MNPALRRFAAFLPAVMLGLAVGLGINAWRHRRTGAAPPPGVVSSQSKTADQPPAGPVPDKTVEPPPADAAEFVQRFTGATAASPLRAQLAKESLAASLTLDAFLTMIRDGKVPPGFWESDAVRERFREWAATDRGRFLDIALGLPETAGGLACLDAALRGITAADFRALMPGWANVPRFQREPLLAKAIAYVARKDPAGALALLNELPFDERKESLINATYSSLLHNLEEKPAEWDQMFQLIMSTAKTLPPDKMRRFVGEALGSITTERANAVWPAIRDSGVDESVQREFLEKWAHSDPVAALVRTVAQFPPGKADGETGRLYSDLATQSVLRLQLLEDKQRHDPQAYLKLADDVPAGPGRDAFLAGVVDQVASGTPALAAQMLPQVPQEHRAQTINMIAELWTAKDAVAASQWVDSLPPGTERDQAAGGFVRRLAESDPERAAQWAVTIKGESERRYALEKVYSTWQRLDAAAATRWVQSEARLTTEDHAMLKAKP